MSSAKLSWLTVGLGSLLIGYLVLQSDGTSGDEVITIADSSPNPGETGRGHAGSIVDARSIRQGDPERAPVPELPLREAESEVHDPVWDSAKRLYEEKITRATHGADYVDAIECIARDTVRKNIESQTKDRAADFAGFHSWESMNARLVELGESGPAAAASLSRLVDASLSASGFAEACALRTWGDPLHLERFDPSAPHDRKLWLEQRRIGVKGLYRFTTSTRVGDRQFCLHFDSAYFPELEDELRSLELVKSDYWNQLQSD